MAVEARMAEGFVTFTKVRVGPGRAMLDRDRASRAGFRGRRRVLFVTFLK